MIMSLIYRYYNRYEATKYFHCTRYLLHAHSTDIKITGVAVAAGLSLLCIRVFLPTHHIIREALELL